MGIEVEVKTAHEFGIAESVKVAKVVVGGNAVPRDFMKVFGWWKRKAVVGGKADDGLGIGWEETEAREAASLRRSVGRCFYQKGRGGEP